MLLSAVLILTLSINALSEFFCRSSMLWSSIIPNKSVNKNELFHISNSSLGATFVSIHIATYNEPPELVIATLLAIVKSRYQNFEVILIDNNTKDKQIWQPVAAMAQKLGPQFRFRHYDTLAGAKAGALNVALALTDACATHVAIIDADYQIAPDFLGKAVAAQAKTGADYVQFPQAYRNVSGSALGVECELSDYFQCFASGAGRPGSMLPTGTLSLFKVSALRNVGGWGTTTITEDAELGIRLQIAGNRGLWVADQGGTGLLPLDYRGLAAQRSRWVAGNVQVLRGLLLDYKFPLAHKDFLNLLSQLTAWVSFWALPAAVLVFMPLAPTLPLAGLIGHIAAITILGSSVLVALRLLIADRSTNIAWGTRCAAFVTKLALSWTAAFAWMPAVFNIRLRFKRTPKSAEGKTTTLHLGLLGLSILFVIAAAVDVLAHRPLETCACVLLASIWLCARHVDRALRQMAPQIDRVF